MVFREIACDVFLAGKGGGVALLTDTTFAGGAGAGRMGGTALIGGCLAFSTGRGTGVGTGTGTGTGVAGIPVSVTKLGLVVFGGSLTKLVVLNRVGAWDGGADGEACLGGNAGRGLRRWEMGSTFGGEAAWAARLGGGTGGGPVTLVVVGSGGGFTGDKAWVPAGGGLATEESMTTIFPGPAFLSGGSWVVGDFRRPVIPLEGSGGMGPLLDSGGLSAIFLCAGVSSENGDRDVERLRCNQEAICRPCPIDWFVQGQKRQPYGVPLPFKVFSMDGKVRHSAEQTFYRI